MAESEDTRKIVSEAVKSALDLMDRERDRNVIRQRFGIGTERRTLEAIGSSFGITRERVRQIEKTALIAVRIRVSMGASAKFTQAERLIVSNLHEMGRAGRLNALADKMGTTESEIELLCRLSEKVQTCNENERLYPGVALTADRDSKFIKKRVAAIVSALKEHGAPVTPEEMFDLVPGYEHPSEVVAMSTISKDVYTFGGVYGLSNWPLVNPRNIKDKIYLVMRETGKPMHYSEVAAAVKSHDFVRNNVSDQAIHNELIKDDRFILVGRGIYALAENGYSKGNINQVIVDVLKENGPMYRDDIIREVLKRRKVREATVLVTMQRNKDIHRINGDADTYAYEPSESAD